MTAPAHPAAITGPSAATVIKAGQLVADGAVTAVRRNRAKGTFVARVRSGTDPRIVYAVRRDPLLGWQCDCPSATPCKHILACVYTFEETR